MFTGIKQILFGLMGSKVAVFCLPGQSISDAGGRGLGALGVRGCRRLEEAGVSQHWSEFPELRVAQPVAREPGGGAWFRSPIVGVWEKRGADHWPKLAGFSFWSPAESRSRGSAECWLLGGGGDGLNTPS